MRTYIIKFQFYQSSTHLIFKLFIHHNQLHFRMQNNKIAVLKLFIDNLNKNTFGTHFPGFLPPIQSSWIHQSSNVKLITYF